MKKNFRLLTLAAAISMLAACSDELVLTPEQAREQSPESNAITFGTYMGKSAQTRADEDASITDPMNTAKLQALGFGVFGYYTGTADYAQNSVANFMYNQKIEYQTDKWTYTPIKYWPNEVGTATNDKVDDQDNDQKNNEATQAGANGGKVSFFAYAPYVASAISETTGITQINESTTLAGTAPTTGDSPSPGTGNQKKGDPTITYKFATTGNSVDLLWGTLDKDKTGNNVIDVANVGKTGATEGTGYLKAILTGYTVGADLTKQKTNGQVAFNFKHALASIGGATKGSTEGTVSNKSGLLIVLDIDKDGAETGGEKDANTVVTVKSITITQEKSEYDSDGDGTIDKTGENAGYTDGGVFNLATGKWISITANTAEGATGATTEITAATDETPGATNLASSIAEPASVTTMSIPSSKSDYYVNGTVEGVLSSTRKNVYHGEASAMMFIPGTKPCFTITIEYIVRTYDPKLAASANDDTGTTSEGGTKQASWSKVTQKISKKVTFQNAVELNKMYSLVMHLGLTSVKFTAEVSNWTIAGDTNENGQIDGDEVALDVEDVYLPINVSDVATTVKAGTGATTPVEVKTPDNTTKYIITVNGLTPGNTLATPTITESGDGYSVSITKPTASSETYTVGTDGQAVLEVTLKDNRTGTAVVEKTVKLEEKKGETVVTTTQVKIKQAAGGAAGGEGE